MKDLLVERSLLKDALDGEELRSLQGLFRLGRGVDRLQLLFGFGGSEIRLVLGLIILRVSDSFNGFCLLACDDESVGSDGGLGHFTGGHLTKSMQWWPAAVPAKSLWLVLEDLAAQLPHVVGFLLNGAEIPRLFIYNYNFINGASIKY